jgi:anti-sigma regulatory factor (Ser/Thr protein kinase)
MSDDTKGSEPDLSFEFEHDPSAARLAREAIAPLLHEDGKFADDVQLVTSEIVSNVVEHTHDGGRLDAWDDNPLVLEVEDFDPNIPTIPPVQTEQGGRGLSLVDGLAEEWGVEPTETGKVVWAKFERPTPPKDPPPA